jgi:hypothetical protein
MSEISAIRMAGVKANPLAGRGGETQQRSTPRHAAPIHRPVTTDMIIAGGVLMVTIAVLLLVWAFPRVPR